MWGRLMEQVAAAKFLELFPEFGAHLFAGAEVLTLCADGDANGMGLCGASAACVLEYCTQACDGDAVQANGEDHYDGDHECDGAEADVDA